MTSFEEYWNRLSDEQRGAVLHGAGPAAVCACAGSGKTACLIGRIWYLLRCGFRADQICACAFTNKAADEINERLARFNMGQNARVGTIHSVSLEIVRSAGPAFGATAEVDAKNTLFYELKTLLWRDLKAQDILTAAHVANFIAAAKARVLPAIGPGADQADTALHDLGMGQLQSAEKVTAAIEAYQRLEALALERNLLTFDDMPMRAALALRHDPGLRERWQQRFAHVLVDEAQDLSPAQHEVAQHLAGPGGNLILIGDLAQAIFAWRHADLKCFERFIEAAPSVYKIRHNYRASRELCKHASKLIAQAPWNLTGSVLPHDAAPQGDRASGYSHEHASTEAEAAAVSAAIVAQHAAGRPWGNFAVLYRITAQIRAVEQALIEARVPYHILAGRSFYERSEVLDILAYLRIACGRDLYGEDARRVVNRPFRYLGKATIESISQEARANNVHFLDALRDHDPPRPSQRKAIMGFLDIVYETNQQVADGGKPEDVIGSLLKRTRYVAWLDREEGEDADKASPDAHARAASVLDFKRAARHFQTVPELLDYAERMRAALTMRRTAKGPRPDAVVLCTIHSAKGLEFPIVHLIGAVDGLLPLRSNPLREEEHRLFYVALTRAKEQFVAHWAREMQTKKGAVDAKPSPFIKMAGLGPLPEAPGLTGRVASALASFTKLNQLDQQPQQQPES